MTKKSDSVLWTYAFRPFFVLNALFATAAVAAWLALMLGWSWPGAPVNPLLWHGHEMLIGFVMAAVAGFALTAVATWTGRPAVSGAPLCLLVSCWLAGRLAMALSGMLHPLLVAVVDMSFPLTLLALFTREVVGGSSRRNFPVAGIVALMATLNLVYHLNAESAAATSRTALLAFVHLALLLVTVIGGRIIPNFTANWLRRRGVPESGKSLPVTRNWLEVLVFSLTILTGLSIIVVPQHAVVGPLALATAAAHAVRLSQWRGESTRAEPLLLILHLAYAWLPVGYMLYGLSALGWPISGAAALHALTVGAVGTMILAVTTRVALGHTGRPLRAPAAAVWSYVLITVAALIRVFGPSTGYGYQLLIDLSGVAWVAAFISFLFGYWAILTGPRASREE